MKRFGPTIRHTLLGITALLMLASCNREPDTKDASGTVKVRIPFPEEGGGYSLKVVALSGINSMYEFSGSYGNFYLSPTVDRTQKIRGTRPKTHFMKTKEGIFVPQDELSQQMAVIYAHLQNLNTLDNEVGVGDLNAGPRDVGMMVRYGNPGGAGLQVNNAFYNPDTDAILLVPYTASEMPIAVNGGILAHEHFHSLYYKLVGRKLGQKAQAHGEKLKSETEGGKEIPTTLEGFHDESLTLAQRTNLFVYLGMNEGLADFWAWVYTGDADFLNYSVSSETAARTLKVSEDSLKTLKFNSVSQWRTVVSGAEVNPVTRLEVRCRSIYCLGTEYARSMKAFAEVVKTTRGVSSKEARTLVAKAVVTALPNLAATLKGLNSDEYFEPASFLTLLEASMPEAKPEEKAYLEAMLKRTQEVKTLDVRTTALIKTNDTDTAGVRP